MKKPKILSTVSIATLLMSTAAFADTPADTHGDMKAKTPATIEMENRTKSDTVINNDLDKDAQAAMEKAGEAIKDTAKDVSNATKDAYKDAKRAVSNGAVQTESEAGIISSHTAEEMLGATIYNRTGGERVGNVNDIIVDEDGDVESIVVGDGDVLGLGKEVAIGYGEIRGRTPEGGFIAPLTEKSIDARAAFKAPPRGTFRVSDLMKAKVKGAKNEEIGSVENIAFDGDAADKLVVAYDQILGLGGKMAVLDFDDTIISVENGNKITIRLSEAQTRNFADMKAQRK